MFYFLSSSMKSLYVILKIGSKQNLRFFHKYIRELDEDI